MKPDNYVSARASRAFSASAERVFDAWLDPAKVRVWWTLSAAAAGRGASETVERVQIEPHLGGSFSILVRRDGKQIDHTGTYLEMERPRRLAFTWTALDVEAHQEPGQVARDDSRDYSRVVVEITPQATGCEVTLTHEMHPDWQEFVARGSNAWRTMLDAINQLVSELPVA
jgi:uncharacterized protein YndB with AHSA1/START domain